MNDFLFQYRSIGRPRKVKRHTLSSISHVTKNSVFVPFREVKFCVEHETGTFLEEAVKDLEEETKLYTKL
jgi:hypothetical protein